MIKPGETVGYTRPVGDTALTLPKLKGKVVKKLLADKRPIPSVEKRPASPKPIPSVEKRPASPKPISTQSTAVVPFAWEWAKAHAVPLQSQQFQIAGKTRQLTGRSGRPGLQEADSKPRVTGNAVASRLPGPFNIPESRRNFSSTNAGDYRKRPPAITPDHHAVLGLKPGASQTDIGRAFRELSRKYHPDVNQWKGAAGHYAKVTAAYNALRSRPL